MKKQIRTQVKKNEIIQLAQWPTVGNALYTSKKEYKKILAENSKELSSLQALHYASNERALLLIFQGMDGSGKDGTIEHVLSGINPQGCQVTSFKQPTKLELQHDFLWRSMQKLPELGQIAVFNRSYYEDVLITRVHPELIFGSEKKDFWKERFRSIHDFERHLHHNGTDIIKFFLHLSKDEQKLRFLARIDEPGKNWKLTEADLKERSFWNDYQKVYGECLGSTSTEKAPWHIIPADDKLNARLLVSNILLDYFKNRKMNVPLVDKAQSTQLKVLRKQLVIS